MLAELRIRNFAVVEEASLSFGPGLNVLSGETGAGKTIIMSAIALLLGGRASPDLIRAQTTEAIVEGRFELEGEAAMPELAERMAGGRELLIRRALAAGGRSRAAVNDEMASVQSLSRLGAALVQIYGQHEQQALLRPESHLKILDRFAGLDGELEKYRLRYAAAREKRARAADLKARSEERARLLELARFRAEELQRAVLKPGEDEALAGERAVLANAARLGAAAGEAAELLSGDHGAIGASASAQKRIAETAALDPKLKEPLELLAGARLNLEEAARALANYAARIEADPARLEQVDGRLQEIAALKRKYGGTVASALETLERSRAEIAELDDIGESAARAERELSEAIEELACAAEKLTDRRGAAAADLKRRMEAELKTLGMRRPVFEARVEPAASSDGAFILARRALGPDGADAVELYLSPNLGQPPMALARTASGGELSRVMLALKRLEAQRRGIATLIFDEVDAGIGGAVAQVVGRKLKQLARYHQVLCVTHLAQIAVFADSHFVVEKEERRGSTRTRVVELAAENREAELARMIGGDASEKFRRAARELLARAAL